MERADLEQINIMAAICYLHSFKPEYGSVGVNGLLSGVYVSLLPVFSIARISQHRFVLLSLTAAHQVQQHNLLQSCTHHAFNQSFCCPAPNVHDVFPSAES